MKILITEEITKDGKEILESAGFDIEEKFDLNKEELKNALKGIDGIIIRSKTKMDREVIESTDSLKVIGRAGIGIDNIDVEAARGKGIEILITPNSPTISVSELTFAMILSCARNLKKASLSLMGGKWEKNNLKGLELYGKTLGVVGLGRIGREVARKALAFGMNVVFFDPMVDEFEICKRCELEELCSTSDIITVHVPLIPETENLISTEAFANMKKEAILVNCSRGGVVDEDALYDALVNEKIWGAGLDVFKEEPVTNHKLISLPNVIATPHLGSQTIEGQLRVSTEIATNIVNFFSTK